MITERWLPRQVFGRVVLAAAVGFFLLVIWAPIVQTFHWSLETKEPGVETFVGLDNYRKLLTADPVFWKSLGVTFQFALYVVPGVVILGLVLALALQSMGSPSVRGFYGAAFFGTYVIPLVAVALVWRYIYLPGQIGMLNTILGTVGIAPVRWLNSSEWALRSIALVRIWREAGFAAILFLAGLQAIPAVYSEAAVVDGAGWWQRVRHITLPLLTPTFVFVVIITTLSAFLAFTEVYVMTYNPGISGGDRGGPSYSTNLMSYYIYATAISYNHEGYGSAIAAIFFLIMVAVGYLQYRLIKVGYEF